MSVPISINLATSGITPAELIKRAQLVERAGFDAITVSDPDLLSLAATEIAAFIAPHTQNVGILVEVDIALNEPFYAAIQLATVDHISGGRAGWLVQARDDDKSARAYGRATPSPQRIAEEIRDGIDVVRRLWDSWEDDAVIRNVATGRYLDRAKVHNVNFTGAHYSIASASIVPRSPQGRPPIIVPAQFDDTEAYSNEDIVKVASIDADLSAADSAKKLISEIRDLAGEQQLIRLVPSVFERDVRTLSTDVLPALRDEGLVAETRAGTTLRNQLGLGEAINLYEHIGDVR